MRFAPLQEAKSNSPSSKGRTRSASSWWSSRSKRHIENADPCIEAGAIGIAVQCSFIDARQPTAERAAFDREEFRRRQENRHDLFLGRTSLQSSDPAIDFAAR